MGQIMEFKVKGLIFGQQGGDILWNYLTTAILLYISVEQFATEIKVKLIIAICWLFFC